MGNGKWKMENVIDAIVCSTSVAEISDFSTSSLRGTKQASSYKACLVKTIRNDFLSIY